MAPDEAVDPFVPAGGAVAGFAPAAPASDGAGSFGGMKSQVMVKETPSGTS